MAALSYTYAELAAALQSWPVETDPEFVTEIPKLIQHGELRLTRELGLNIFDVVVQANIASGVATVTKPANMLAPLDLFYTSGGKEIHLTRVTREFAQEFNSAGATGLPRYYAELNLTQWLLAPKPNFTTVNGLSITAIQRNAGLNSASGTSTSWLSQNMPDLLLDACLLAAERFLKNDPRWVTTKRDFDLKLSDAKAEVSQLRRVTADDAATDRQLAKPANSDAPPQAE